MKLAAIAKLIKADGYCKLYKVFYDDCRTYDLYIGTKTAIFPLTGFPKAQNESELATLLGISKKESMESEICARSATKCTAKRWIVFMKAADMEDKTDNSQKKEEHDSLKPARDAIATAMRAAQFAKAIGTPLPKPLKWQREFYDATGVFPYGWYECPVCGYRTDWEPHACPICHTLLEP